jgi:hypothetical protein
VSVGVGIGIGLGVGVSVGLGDGVGMSVGMGVGVAVSVGLGGGAAGDAGLTGPGRRVERMTARITLPTPFRVAGCATGLRSGDGFGVAWGVGVASKTPTAAGGLGCGEGRRTPK